MRYQELESSCVELKKELPKNDQIIKTIVGFRNMHGGKLVIGVENDGTIVGLDDEIVQHVMEYLEKSIFEATSPPIVVRVYAQRIFDKTILIIEVSQGQRKPYYISSEGLEKGVYIRLGRSTMRANNDMIQELSWQARAGSYDTMPIFHATLDDLDMHAIASVLDKKSYENKEPVHEDLLRAYHLIAEEHGKKYPTVAGILLFGKDPQHFLSEAFIIATHFAGIQGREALAAKDCTGTLFNQLKMATEFIESQLNVSFTIKALRRTETFEIPLEALREMLLNALIHRNYHVKAPIKIAIYRNRVEIFSPGNFPGPLTPHNLTMGLSFIRNIALCKVFRKAKLIEKLGTGFTILFQSYAQAKLPKPEVVEGELYVKAILPRPGPHDLALQKSKQVSGDHIDREIMDMLARASEISTGDVVSVLGISRATANRHLTKLIEKRLIDKRGKGSGTRYSQIKKLEKD